MIWSTFTILLLANLGQTFSPNEAMPRTLLQPFVYRGGRVPVAMFDADSTVRISKGVCFAPCNAQEVMMLPGVSEKIAELTRQGYFVVIMSNQHNLAKRATVDNVLQAMQETIRGMTSRGGAVHYYDFSTTPEEAKPNTIMADRLNDYLKRLFGPAAEIDRQRSFMVGDAAYRKPVEGYAGDIRPDGRMGFNHGNFDRHFAERLGIQFHEPQTFFGWVNEGVENFLRPIQVEGYVAASRERYLGPKECAKFFQGIHRAREVSP